LKQKGLLIVVSSPSGAGKTTVCGELLSRYSDIFLSVSATTRAPRPGEIDGKDYWFLSPEVFEARVASQDFLEHATVFGQRYGTLRAPVEAQLSLGRDVLLDVDWQGGRAISHRAKGPVVRVFILPPSVEELRRRLEGRGTDASHVIDGRMERARSEAQHWAEYDYVIVNRVVEETVRVLESIRIAEHAKRVNQPDLFDWTASL
jgi:guanylate kinase